MPSEHQLRWLCVAVWPAYYHSMPSQHSWQLYRLTYRIIQTRDSAAVLAPLLCPSMVSSWVTRQCVRQTNLDWMRQSNGRGNGKKKVVRFSTRIGPSQIIFVKFFFWTCHPPSCSQIREQSRCGSLTHFSHNSVGTLAIWLHTPLPMSLHPPNHQTLHLSPIQWRTPNSL